MDNSISTRFAVKDFYPELIKTEVSKYTNNIYGKTKKKDNKKHETTEDLMERINKWVESSGVTIVNLESDYTFMIYDTYPIRVFYKVNK